MEDLRRGPWMEQSELARRKMLTLSEKDRTTYLRPHWVGPEGINKTEEIQFRESLDRVLEYLQLIELGIETGYFPPEVARPEVVQEILPLVSSLAIRQYIYHYDFLPVRFLASRFQIDLGWPALEPPNINPQAEVRFATFLSLHSSWTADRAVVRFTMLMDSYRFVHAINAKYFRAYLSRNADSGKSKLNPEITETQQRLLDELCTGCGRFVQILGDLFTQLDAEEQPLFGSFYAYWLAHFFGFILSEQGYRKALPGWDRYIPNRTALILGTITPLCIRPFLKNTAIGQCEFLKWVWAATILKYPSVCAMAGREHPFARGGHSSRARMCMGPISIAPLYFRKSGSKRFTAISLTKRLSVSYGLSRI